MKPNLLLLTLPILLAACTPDPPAPAQQPDLPTVTVQTAPVTRLTHPLVEPIVGTVTARTKPIVSSKINGTITSLHADVGDHVKAGQLLAEIEAREIQARLDQTLPQLERAIQDAARSKQLLAQNASSQQQDDDAAARVKTMTATVEEARALLAYTRITSPIDGLVRTRRVDIGDLALPGHPLFELEGLADFRIEAAIPESLTGTLHTGDHAQIRIDSAGRNLTATLADLSPSADPLSRTFLARYDIETTTGLVSGQFARLLLPLGQTPELTIPQTALVHRGQLEITFVVDNHNARLRLIKTGKQHDGQVAILSGLDEGEQVITQSPDQLQDGQPIEVRP